MEGITELLRGPSLLCLVGAGVVRVCKLDIQRKNEKTLKTQAISAVSHKYFISAGEEMKAQTWSICFCSGVLFKGCCFNHLIFLFSHRSAMYSMELFEDWKMDWEVVGDLR